MKIAMVVKELAFGWSSHTEPLVKHLRRLGVEVKLFIGRGSDLITSILSTKLSRNTEFDLLHIQGSPYGSFLHKKIPVVTTVHTTLYKEKQFQSNPVIILGEKLESLTLRSSDRVIIVNEILRGELIKQYNIPNEIITHIPNAVDTLEFDLLGELNRECTVFTCGRNIPRKGFDVLIEACNKVPVQLLLAHGTLTRKELLHAYKTSMVFVCPSYYETGPITVMEAMAAKTPVICSDIPAVKELIRDNTTGLLFEPGNVQDLTRKLLHLISNSFLSKRLAENAYNHLKANYNWRVIAKETKQLYEEVLCEFY